MKLSKDYQYQVLCEDAQIRTFVNAFLAENGINEHKVSFCRIPGGKGCGEAYVRRELPKEVKRLKATSYIRKVLIVCTDADSNTVDECLNSLVCEVENQIRSWDRIHEPVIIWIPKRQIETWIRFLNGEIVDENMSFRHSGKPISCKDAARRFLLYCQGNEKLDCNILGSLEVAKEEYLRVCQLQK